MAEHPSFHTSRRTLHLSSTWHGILPLIVTPTSYIGAFTNHQDDYEPSWRVKKTRLPTNVLRLWRGTPEASSWSTSGVIFDRPPEAFQGGALGPPPRRPIFPFVDLCKSLGCPPCCLILNLCVQMIFSQRKLVFAPGKSSAANDENHHQKKRQLRIYFPPLPFGSSLFCFGHL